MRMRNVFACLLFLTAFPAYAGTPLEDALAAAQAEGKKPPQAEASAPSPEERLDKLFADLRRASDEGRAKRIAAQIEALWAQSGSATIDLLLQWADKAAQERRYPAALDFLNEAIALNPDYAEAWNRRAAVYIERHEYAHAMSDIERALALEPRHFDAMTAMAGVLRARGLKQQALKAYEQALAVYPMMREAQKGLDELTEELSDTRT